MSVGGVRIQVVEAGFATTVQDAGRVGLAALGVPRSGAVDRALAASINRAAGNVAAAPLVETAGGLVIEARGDVLVATSEHDAPVSLRERDRLRVPVPVGRAWAYLAVRGGFEVPRVLGSASHDTLSGIGPPPITAGTELAVGTHVDRAGGRTGDVLPGARSAGPVRIRRGPRIDWFDDDAWAVLLAGPWTTGAETGRVGVRLDGPTLRRRRGDELPSEGLVPGAIQVPPDSRPVVMLADHPTTGGYPVIAVVDADDVGAVAQRRPGDAIRFVDVSARRGSGA